MATFIQELREIPIPDDAPPAGRRPLRDLDADTRTALTACGDRIDTDGAIAMWQSAVAAPAFDGTPTWIHADLLGPTSSSLTAP